MNYMQSWSEKTLYNVADKFLGDHPMLANSHLDEICKHFVHVHQSISIYSAKFLIELNRLNVITPKHYLEYIHIYIQLLGKNLCNFQIKIFFSVFSPFSKFI